MKQFLSLSIICIKPALADNTFQSPDDDKHSAWEESPDRIPYRGRLLLRLHSKNILKGSGFDQIKLQEKLQKPHLGPTPLLFQFHD